MGHFFGPLIDEQHDDASLGVTGMNGFCNLFQQYCFTGPGRGNDQAPRTFSDRCDQIDNTHGRFAGNRKIKPLVRGNCGQPGIGFAFLKFCR